MAATTLKSIFDIEPDAVDEARLDAEADAAIESGQFVPNNRVVEWLKSRGTPNESPCPMPEAH